ncbi:hypothetical protein V8C40DRAFT_235976 [Trichoderma camerunense]
MLRALLTRNITGLDRTMSRDVKIYDWYQGETPAGEDANKTELAERAFRFAIKQFTADNKLSGEELRLLKCTTSVDDVQRVVADSMARYEQPGKHVKIKKWLQKAASMMNYYTNILEVFMQHHPEYVALVWGVMKILFTSIIHHEQTAKLLAKSISQIAAQLPRIDFVTVLYPTGRIQLAVEQLYVALLEFLLRAHKWCRASRLRHLIGSLTQPPELVYADLLEAIAEKSREITELAVAGSQAELRHMHRKVDALVAKMELSDITIKSLLTQITTSQAVQSSSLVDTNLMLSDLQLSQALSSFSHPFDDPERSYQYHMLLRKRRSTRVSKGMGTNSFWLSPKLKRWASSKDSALTIIKGGPASRLSMRDFCVDVLKLLSEEDIPALWALPNQKPNPDAGVIDLLKFLTFQALRLNGRERDEKQVAKRYSQFQSARTANEWLNLFKEVVQSIGREVYLIIDTTTVQMLEDSLGFNLIRSLDQMLKSMGGTGKSTTLKIVFIIYELKWIASLPKDMLDPIVSVQVRRQKHKPVLDTRRLIGKHLTKRQEIF